MRSNHICHSTFVGLMLLALAMPLFAGNEANPDAIELAPLPLPVEFESDMDKPVAFDASATVTVECPETNAVAWLARHFSEWYGQQAPKVEAGATGLLPTTNHQLSTTNYQLTNYQLTPKRMRSMPTLPALRLRRSRWRASGGRRTH